MQKLLLWVLLCLPALAHAQNNRDAFLQAFEQMDKADYKYSTTSIAQIVGEKKTLPTTLYEPLYTRNPRFDLAYAKENFTVYPIGKVKNSEGIYSVVYLEVAKRTNSRGGVYYMGEILITTLDFNDKEARHNSLTLDKRGGQDEWETFLQPYYGISVDYFLNAQTIFFLNTKEQENSGTFAFDAKTKTYQKR
jgi:hypothetical protein